MTTRNINVCFSGDVEGELCEETGVDIVGALDIIGEVNYKSPTFVTEKSYQQSRMLKVVNIQVCGDDAAKDFSEKELVDRWATAIQTKR